MTTRYNIGDFNIANPVYAGATVSFYTVSGGAKTTTLATLYAASTGTTQGSNPATLDSDGKLAAPLYVEVPVIATISGLGSVSDHDTGIMGLAEGAASTSATAAAASQVAAAASQVAAASSASASAASAVTAAAAAASVGQRKAATVGGTVDAITATFSPVFANLAASAGIVLAIPLAGANATTTPTLAIDGLTAKTIVKGSGAALVAGDIPGGDFVGLFVYDQSLDKFQMINPHGVVTNFSGKSFIDEDDMASNSPTAVPSQQSVKAYVDAFIPVGGVVQSVDTTLATVVACTGAFGIDDTIPQNTEGTEVLVASAFTPTNASNRLRIEFWAPCISNSVSNHKTAIALFQDSTADAIAVTGATSLTDSRGWLVHEMAAGTTSATTFKIRISNENGGTTYVNSSSSNLTRSYGGISKARIRITEIKV